MKSLFFKTTLRKTSFFLLFLGLTLGLEQIFWYKCTDNFRLGKIEYNLPLASKEEDFFLRKEKTELLPIFNQNFTYLAKGHHAYAFISEDGQYILKFPRFHKFREPFWSNWFCIPKNCKKNIPRNKERLKHILDSHQIAHDLLKEETGIIYLHTKRTDFFEKKISLIDKMGRKFLLDLNLAGFVLQKKFTLIGELLPALIQKNDIEGIKKITASLIRLKMNRAKKHIMNKDKHGIGRNHGIEGENAYEIDIGSYEIRDTLSSKEEFIKEVRSCTSDFKILLIKLLPNGKEFYENEMQNQEEKFFKE
jgi:hypothetical protein